MRTNENRLAKLEAAAGLASRAAVHVVDYCDGDLNQQIAVYRAATPESHRARLIVTVVDAIARRKAGMLPM